MTDNVKNAELLRRANALPASPGVYIMKDRQGRVIYVGKSRKLKNRVSQYFQTSSKGTKTDRMVSLVWDFETVLCDTEIEALTLENAFIKQHSPKYNIKLKDAKSYPYIKITDEEYPRLVCTRQRTDDKARYFGPYSGTATVYAVIGTVSKTLRLPSCKRVFPRDIGRGRPCIYYQMGQCSGLCTGDLSRDEYTATIKQAADLLGGRTAALKRELADRMAQAASEERYEEAARCRDVIAALERLRERQKVVSAPGDESDIIALYDGGDCSCVSVFAIRDGVLNDKNDYIFGSGEIADAEGMSAFIAGHYKAMGYIPPKILLSFPMDDGDRETLEDALTAMGGHKIHIRTPERGEARRLCELALTNAEEKAREYRESAARDESALLRLAELLGLEVYPSRIEAYDISNIGTESIRAGMIVCEEGKFNRRDYRTFGIKSVRGTDDYAAMREALTRRLSRLADESGSFSQLPDLILLDGGRGHVSVVRGVMHEFGVDIPVFGMVKDDYHKTRALCTDTSEINIARERQVFMLIYRIQEEVHRFTSGKTSAAKRKTLKTSSLTAIPGIGEKKAKLLLAAFGGLAGVKRADISALGSIKGISERDAREIYGHFHRTGDVGH